MHPDLIHFFSTLTLRDGYHAGVARQKRQADQKSACRTIDQQSEFLAHFSLLLVTAHLPTPKVQRWGGGIWGSGRGKFHPHFDLVSSFQRVQLSDRCEKTTRIRLAGMQIQGKTHISNKPNAFLHRVTKYFVISKPLQSLVISSLFAKYFQKGLKSQGFCVPVYS